MQRASPTNEIKRITWEAICVSDVETALPNYVSHVEKLPQTKPRAPGQDTRFRKHKPQVSIMESKQSSLARKIKKQDYTNQER